MLPESKPNFALATLSQKIGIVESKSTKYDIHSQNENSGTKSKNSTFWLSKSDLHSENEKKWSKTGSKIRKSCTITYQISQKTVI